MLGGEKIGPRRDRMLRPTERGKQFETAYGKRLNTRWDLCFLSMTYQRRLIVRVKMEEVPIEPFRHRYELYIPEVWVKLFSCVVGTKDG